MNHEVLVLNSDYEPLNICNIRRVMVMVFMGKVDVLHEDSFILHTVSREYRSPSVVRLKNHIKRPQPQLRLSRRSVLARDNYTCQYLWTPGTRPHSRSYCPETLWRAHLLGKPGLLLQKVQYTQGRQDRLTDRFRIKATAEKTKICAVYQPNQVYHRRPQRSMA